MRTRARLVLTLFALGVSVVAREGLARADACRWSYPVGEAPDSPAPFRDGHPVGGTNLPAFGVHLGSDFWQGGGCTDLGKPVYAAADGVVVEIADGLGSYLDVVVLRHDDPEIGPVYTMYGHIDRAGSLAEGQTVTRRTQLGTIGNVLPHGFSPCHLHFEILSEEAYGEGPFCSGCAAARIRVSPGYDQKRGVTKATHPASGDPYLEVKDAVAGNRWYVAEPFLDRRIERGCDGPPDGASDAGAPEVPAPQPADGGAEAAPRGGGPRSLDDPDAPASCHAARSPSSAARGGFALLVALAALARMRRRAP